MLIIKILINKRGVLKSRKDRGKRRKTELSCGLLVRHLIVHWYAKSPLRHRVYNIGYGSGIFVFHIII